MTINRNNFEAYLLDYIEGNLDPVFTAELMAFLAENPEFDNYLPENEIKKLDTGDQVFVNKNILKKDFQDIQHINPTNFDEFCIASVEGLLNPNQEKRLHKYIEMNPGKEKDLAAYRNMKLKPDHNILFENKQSLKKQGGKIVPVRILYFAVSIAAAILFIIWLMPAGRQTGQAAAGLSELEILVPQKTTVHKNHHTVRLSSAAAVNTSAPLSPSDKNTASDEVPYIVEEITLASIEPLRGNVFDGSEYPLPELGNAPKKNPARNMWNDIVNSENMLQAIVSHIDFWKTAEKAISGINYLTESQLSLAKTSDGLQVNTESYSIEGSKVK
ncbi:MAG TPA: hypothetical protein VK179_20325 [Bacteroidales bacterium]|nr:hypothetical protein [Bacteroidales bacterium]